MRCKGTRVISLDDEQQDASRDETTDPVVLQPSTVSRQQNRVLALTLVSVVGLVFATVLILVGLYHYAEAHHAISGL